HSLWDRTIKLTLTPPGNTASWDQASWTQYGLALSLAALAWFSQVEALFDLSFSDLEYADFSNEVEAWKSIQGLLKYNALYTNIWGLLELDNDLFAKLTGYSYTAPFARPIFYYHFFGLGTEFVSQVKFAGELEQW